MRSTSPIGASKYANATAILPSMYKNSFKKLSDKISLELFFIANKKLIRYERINIKINILRMKAVR